MNKESVSSLVQRNLDTSKQIDRLAYSGRIIRVLTWLIPYMGMFFLSLMLWLPFGFKTTGLIEEIGITSLLESGMQLFFATPQSFPLIRMRPFQMFVFAASYALDHNSYLFYNVFMFLFFFGKMVVVYWLVLQFLKGKKALAFVTAVLFTFYPADAGLFALRTIHIHSALLAYLFSVYLLLQFWKFRGWLSWLSLLGAALCLIFSLGQYEVALAAAVITPFILLYFTRPNRRFFLGVAVWYGALAIVLLYAFWANHQVVVQSYEGEMIQQATSSMEFVKGMLDALLLGYKRQFLGWSDALNKIDFLPFYWTYFVGGLIISLAVMWVLTYKQSAQGQVKPATRQQYGVLMIGGVLLFAIGVAPYLPFPSHRLENFRIYFLAMLGSALVLSLALYLVSRLMGRFSELVFMVLALPFIGLALLNAFHQQQDYVNFSLQQQSILQQTITQAPQIKRDTTILFMDKTGVLDQPYVFFNGVYLSTMLQYLYGDSTIVSSFCPAAGGVTSTGVHCQFDQNFLHMSADSGPLSGTEPLLNLPTDKLLIFTTEPYGGLRLLSREEAARDFQITDYNPQALIVGQTLPRRAEILFSCVPAMSCYKLRTSIPNSIFELSSSKNIGVGWRPAELDDANGTFRWSVDPVSKVNVRLVSDKDLLVEFKVLHWVEESVIDSLRLTVYGQNIPLTFTKTEDGGRIYRATLPRSILIGQSPYTDLVFTIDRLSVTPFDQPLGFALNWLYIVPAS